MRRRGKVKKRGMIDRPVQAISSCLPLDWSGEEDGSAPARRAFPRAVIGLKLRPEPSRRGPGYRACECEADRLLMGGGWFAICVRPSGRVAQPASDVQHPQTPTEPAPRLSASVCVACGASQSLCIIEMRAFCGRGQKRQLTHGKVKNVGLRRYGETDVQHSSVWHPSTSSDRHSTGTSSRVQSGLAIPGWPEMTISCA